jgi:tetratricopeptide (TPR) repeat protein
MIAAEIAPAARSIGLIGWFNRLDMRATASSTAAMISAKRNKTYYSRGVELYPQNFLVWTLWGRFDLTHKNPKEGLEETTRAYQLAPENPNVDYYYARALFENGRYVDAEPLLEQLSSHSDQENGRRQILLLALAQTEMRLGRLGEAENVLDRLSEIDGSFPGLHSARGNVYKLEGKLRSAREEFWEEFEITGDLRSKEEAVALRASGI